MMMKNIASKSNLALEMTFNCTVECEAAKKYTILTFACQNWLLLTWMWQTCIVILKYKEIEM